MTEDVSKADMLAELGFGGDLAPAFAVLERAGLSNAKKQRISASKRNQAERALAEALIRVCNRGDCRTAARDDLRETVDAATQADCEICGGSSQRDAVDRMIAACARAGVVRVVVVGGSPVYREVLHRHVAGRLELRLIDGQTARTQRDADADVKWADLVLIWGPTQLDHKVSELYSGPKVVIVRRRSPAQLAEEAVTFASRRTPA